jgi:hypothetical protein
MSATATENPGSETMSPLRHTCGASGQAPPGSRRHSSIWRASWLATTYAWSVASVWKSWRFSP